MDTRSLLHSLITLGLYLAVSTTLYYGGARATLTRRVRQHYPDWFADLMYCPACSGFWYGMACAAFLGRPLGLPFAGLPSDAWVTIPLAGAVVSALVPITVWLQLVGLEYVHRIDYPVPDPAQKIADALRALAPPPETRRIGALRVTASQESPPSPVACDCPGVRGQHVRAQTLGCVYSDNHGPRAA